MSTTGLRDMPVMDAYWVEALRGEHYRAMFPDGERTYPSRYAMTRAAARVGIAVRFSDGRMTPPRRAPIAGTDGASGVSRLVASNAPGQTEPMGWGPGPRPVGSAETR